MKYEISLSIMSQRLQSEMKGKSFVNFEEMRELIAFFFWLRNRRADSLIYRDREGTC